mmetsp:Transcript_30602/g.60043  ORF Transcript_30602/g.60043 Transcript_30602/m.60043 type:complete len:150 (-) Transcript_30602:62-511(-)
MVTFCLFSTASTLVLLSATASQDSVELIQQSLAIRSAHVQQQNDQQQNGRAVSFRPNGPMGMNMTHMNAKDLPTQSRHVNQETVSADWGQEYPWKGSPQDLFMDNSVSKPMKAKRNIPGPQHWQPWFVVTLALGASAVILTTLGCLAAM